MKLSIMFITYNRKKELIRAIKSCISNRIYDMEIIIVDNNSSDGTEKEVKNLLIENNVKFTYYFSEKNLGVAGGRNKAFSLCSGEYVFCLDDDAVIKSKNLLINTCRYMDDNKDVAVLAYNIHEPKSGEDLIGKLEKKKNKENECRCLSFVGAAHTLRRKVFLERLYPENLFFGSEELYASFSAWNSGYNVKYIPNQIVHHIPSSINRTAGKERDYNFILNQYIIKKLVYPFGIRNILKIILFLRLLKNNMVSIEYFSRIKKDMEKRYSKDEVNRMSYDTFYRLCKNFGFKYIF
ncbi:glycosyltransferase [Clostridium sardiniense]|uniref:Glycosyltransferase n=1 Tax=Clostridium sardiniense TaxID=29369 RepID=A0ABS7KTL7_CLOSR|nr:glycosyltransferase [Clostridium sardiniense]MBY0753933.1 glycosyltransferase [Clostridium sardiniense]MDQ0459552.1 GT2 family glycosyltransferase [Clostridium sardiniense]